MKENEKINAGDNRPVLPLTRVNFIAMAVSAVVIIIGFLLMLGPGSGVNGEFNPEKFSNRRVVGGPTIALLGFVSIGKAIIYKPKNKE